MATDPESEMAVPNWVSILGKFHLEGRDLIFEGGVSDVEGRVQFEVGNFVSDQIFGGGRIACKIEFQGSCENSAAGLILYYYPQTGAFVSAALGVGGVLCSVATWGGQQWTHHSAKGPASQLRPDRSYDLSVSVAGSRVSVSLDSVHVLSTDLPFSLPRGQSGLWALGPNNVRVSQFNVAAEAPKVFVVMQFTEPFNELYGDVVAPVCEKAGFRVVRADETYGPGLIIADIARAITEATIVIADITPDNPNVFWEVGYAHALNKPTVLVAQRDRELPFDVSPFRTLFYDNTIGGKARVEEGLRRHLDAIQKQWSAV